LGLQNLLRPFLLSILKRIMLNPSSVLARF